MIITAGEQRIIEARAVEKGMSLVQLMETAGRCIFAHVSGRYETRDSAITVLCGSGGNGGDGFVAARLLKQGGARPLVVLCSGTPRANAPAQMYKLLISEGVPIVDMVLEWDRVKSSIMDSALIVDAVYGIGFRGELNGDMSRLFRVVNESRAAVVSADMPSGVNADTGVAAKNAVAADETVCFIAKKPANVLKSSKQYCGKSLLYDIGIPRECYSDGVGRLREIDCAAAAKILSPRPDTGHKGDFGKLLMAVGSDRFRGAAVLAALGAYGAGAGLVTVASGEKTLAAVAASVPEAVLLDHEHNAGEYHEALARSSACLVGCGITVTSETKAFFEETVSRASCPMVIDADGLNILAADEALFEKIKSDVVLTPHIGEFARLTGLSAGEILDDRIRCALAYAKLRQVILVLKSDNTVVAFPDGLAYINTAGNSGLAKAGSGDLLSGVIAALLAMGKTAKGAALAGVWLHSLAADMAAKSRDRHSLTAGYIAGFISDAYRETFAGQPSLDDVELN